MARAQLAGLNLWLLAATPALLVISLAACSELDDWGSNSPASAGHAGLDSGGHANSDAGSSATTGGKSSGAGTGGSSAVAGASTGGGGAGVTGGTAGSSTAGGTGVGGNVDRGSRTPDDTCARWQSDTANVDEGTWSGSVDGCNAGDISSDGRENALRLFNLVR